MIFRNEKFALSQNFGFRIDLDVKNGALNLPYRKKGEVERQDGTGLSANLTLLNVMRLLSSLTSGPDITEQPYLHISQQPRILALFHLQFQ